MEVKMTPINELKPHPKNPRVHPDSAIDKLERSIKEFGWTNPVFYYFTRDDVNGKAKQINS